MTMSKDANLVAGTAPCTSCEQANFTTGSELFDPTLLPLVKDLQNELDIAWRFHQHRDTNGSKVVYYLETVVRMGSPFAGYVSFDGPANEDAKQAVADALEAARTFLALAD